jgi:hypothetical protein
MDLKNIGFEQLLTFVKHLPDEKRATLKEALETAPSTSKKTKSPSAFNSLLLEGPVMGAKQFKTFKANREKFDTWRKK